MQQLHLVGFTADNRGLIFSARKGSKSGGFVVTLDDKLLARVDDMVARRDAEESQSANRPKSSLSASVSRLETELGTRLLERTTRQLRLTEAGKTLYRDISKPFAQLRETPLSHSFCRHVVESGGPLEVVDAREHPKVRDNPAIGDYGVVA